MPQTTNFNPDATKRRLQALADRERSHDDLFMEREQMRHRVAYLTRLITAAKLRDKRRARVSIITPENHDEPNPTLPYEVT